MTRRDPWLDNAKMTLVVLVVVGHSWTLLSLSGVTGWLYDALYAWHVPAFVMVTGYLSRSFTWTRARLWLLVRTVAVPYVVFEAALALFRIHVGGERLEDLFADPHWPLWYLAALFFWRLLTPVFTGMPGGTPVAVGVAVAISLSAGWYAGDTLDAARILGLLPFFVLGLRARPAWLELLRGPDRGRGRGRGRGRRVVAVLVLLAIAALARGTERWASTEWLYYRSRYAELDVGDTRALVTRAALLVIGTLGAWAFLALVPRVDGWFARMGAWTLVVYLGHGFVVKAAAYLGYSGWAEAHVALSLPLTTVAAVALALLLAWRPVAARLDLAVDPFGHAQRRVDHAVELAVGLAVARDRREGG